SGHGLREIGDGVVVGKKRGVGRVEDEAVAFVDLDFVAGFVEEQRLDGVGGVAAVVDGGGEKLDEEIAAVRRPANRVREIAEELVAARVFLTLEKAVAMAASILDPDVVVLEVVALGFQFVIDGKGDGVVGTEGEGGDFVVDGAERILEVLGASGRGEEREKKNINAENPEETQRTRRVGR